MTEEQLKRYQAGRCDAHGDRMIAFDEWYLRGYFAALMSELNGVNPFNISMDKPFYPAELMNLRRYALHIDRQVDDFQEIRNYNLHKFAFDRGRDVL